MTAAQPGLHVHLAYRLVVAQATTNFGTWFSRAALALIVLDRPGGAIESALVVAADAVPRAVLGRAIGRIAGRLPPRPTIVAALLTEAALSLSSVALIGHAFSGLITVLALRSISSGVYAVLFQATTPRLIGRGTPLRKLNFTYGLANALAVVLGPAAGGLVAASLGITTALIADALSSVLAILVSWVAMGHPTGKIVGTSARRSGKLGVDRLMVANGMAATAGGLLNVVLPTFSVRVLHIPVAGAGWALALFGTGAVGVTLVGRRLLAEKFESHHIATAGLALSAVTAAMLALHYAPLLSLVLSGAGSALRATSITAVVQERTQDTALPAAMGALQASSSTGLSIGSISGVLLAGVLAPSVMIIAVAFGFGASLLIFSSRCHAMPTAEGRP